MKVIYNTSLKLGGRYACHTLEDGEKPEVFLNTNRIPAENEWKLNLRMLSFRLEHSPVI